MGAGLFALMGCQPWALPDDTPCDVDPPATGEVWATEVSCNDQIPTNGEGTTSDLLLANSRLRAILRTPQDALTLRGIGGATLLDVAPWDGGDALHEIVPVVGGGWLDIEEVSLEPPRIVVTGRVVSILPSHPAAAAGERRTVRYGLEPDTPWITVEGAEGLYLHPRGGVNTWGATMLSGTTLFAAADPTSVEDLGGALFAHGSQRLIVAPAAEGWTLVAGPDGTPVSGTAVGADQLVLLDADDAIVGRVPLGDDGAFDLVVPAHVVAVRGQGTGVAPTAIAPVGPDLALEIGAAGALDLFPVFEGREVDLRATWTAGDGRKGRRTLFAEGDTFDLGSGTFTLELTAGPDIVPTTVRVEIPPEETVVLGVTVPQAFDPGSWVQLGFEVGSDRSRDQRVSDTSAALGAVADGYVYTVFASEDDVTSVARGDDVRFPPRLTFRTGVVHAGPGFRISAWPWSANRRKNLHGGLRIVGLDPEDVAAAMTGGPDDERSLRVDLGWLDLAGPPHTVDPQPHFVALGPPGEGLADWRPWFDWLDATRAILPTGPSTWVPVVDPTSLGEADVEQPLNRGHLCAGTGGILQIDVDGAVPGDVLLPPEASTTADTAIPTTRLPEAPHTITVSLAAPTGDFDRIGIVTTGGSILEEIEAEGDPSTFERNLDPGWIVAFARSTDDPEAWLVTGPVWIGPVP